MAFIEFVQDTVVDRGAVQARRLEGDAIAVMVIGQYLIVGTCN